MTFKVRSFVRGTEGGAVCTAAMQEEEVKELGLGLRLVRDRLFAGIGLGLGSGLVLDRYRYTNTTQLLIETDRVTQLNMDPSAYTRVWQLCLVLALPLTISD